jgi:MYXO-CTERM domain-containing protein
MRLAPAAALAAAVLVLLPGAVASAQGPFGGCTPTPTVSSALPKDMLFPSQANANCFGWQQFVALNWAAAPGECGTPDPSAGPARFGEPGDTAAVVWETFAQASEVFKPDAAAPDPWCSDRPRLLSDTTKLSANMPPPLSDIAEAFPHGAWLTAQSGRLTLYELLLNEDEFNYIQMNRLYDAGVQQDFARSPGINLPDGTSAFSRYGSTGAIEIKAAWLELDDPSLYDDFKTTVASVKYPDEPEPREVTVGLVGLHIIHKTALAQQFVWATFEHVGLNPTLEEVQSKDFDPPYLYFDPGCNPATDHYKCELNTAPGKDDPLDAPMQVARKRPISSAPSDNVAALNQAMWKLIRASNPDSVFLNYQLVDVLWPNQSTPIPPGKTIPLTEGDPQPPPAAQPVANTTLETYVQDATCLDCHSSAPIATVQAGANAAPPPQLASDYSFLLSRATTAPSEDGFPTLPVVLGAGAAALAAAAAVTARRRRRRS